MEAAKWLAASSMKAKRAVERPGLGRQRADEDQRQRREPGQRGHRRHLEATSRRRARARSGPAGGGAG